MIKRKPSIGTPRKERGLAMEERWIRRFNRMASGKPIVNEHDASGHEDEDMDKLLYQTEPVDD